MFLISACTWSMNFMEGVCFWHFQFYDCLCVEFIIEQILLYALSVAQSFLSLFVWIQLAIVAMAFIVCFGVMPTTQGCYPQGWAWVASCGKPLVETRRCIACRQHRRRDALSQGEWEHAANTLHKVNVNIVQTAQNTNICGNANVAATLCIQPFIVNGLKHTQPKQLNWFVAIVA